MEVRYSKSALAALRRSDKRKLIREKIDALAEDPSSMNVNVTKLRGRSEYRLRVQNWRVVFRIEDDILIVDDIAPRGAVYEVKL